MLGAQLWILYAQLRKNTHTHISFFQESVILNTVSASVSEGCKNYVITPCFFPLITPPDTAKSGTVVAGGGGGEEAAADL
jgi:hypothetical protein